MQKLHEMNCENSQIISKIENLDLYLNQVSGWQLTPEKNAIKCQFSFKNFKQTMFFINAVAYLCEKQMHHPDIKFGFNYCEIAFTTHDIKALSINDFICAAKINQLIL
jgi:4a-hydroxytetrahydrobiopterin dehydratase